MFSSGPSMFDNISGRYLFESEHQMAEMDSKMPEIIQIEIDFIYFLIYLIIPFVDPQPRLRWFHTFLDKTIWLPYFEISCRVPNRQMAKAKTEATSSSAKQMIFLTFLRIITFEQE